MASLVAIMYGLSIIPASSGFLLVVSGAAGLALFVWWEMRVQSPVLEMRLFRESRAFLFSNLAALINYCATFAIMFLISLYLQYVKGFSAQHAGIILVSQPVTQALFSPLAGKLSDRIEPRIVASAGMALTVIGLAVFMFIGGCASVLAVPGNLVLLGLGFALFSSPNTNAIMSSIDKKHFGVASGILATMRVTGQMFSMGIVMVTLSLFHLSGVMIGPAYHDAFLRSTRTAFTIFALCCLAGVLASLARGKTRE
jgi:MFS family permease